MYRTSCLHSWISLLILAGSISAPARATDYEPLPQLTASAAAPADLLASDAYRVLEPVTNDGFMNTYRLQSAFGTFEVEGRALLRVRGKEIEAMKELSELSKTKVFTDAVEEGLRRATIGQVETVQAFADHPVETIKGVPAGVNRMFKRYKGQAQDLHEDYKEKREEKKQAEAAGEAPTASEQASATAGKAVDAGEDYARKYLGISAAERRWAAKVGVDPYTSNEQLRKMISTVSKVDAAGRFSVRLVSIPSIPGLGTLRQVNKLVWETDPYELKKRNQELLAACDVDQATMEGFFENIYLSPTLQTLITNALQMLGGVKDRGTLVAKAAAVESESSAWFMAESAHLLAWYHKNRAPLDRLLADAPATAGVTKSGTVLGVTAADHVVWTEDLERAAQAFMARAKQTGARDVEAAFLGSISPRAREELSKLGYRVVADIAAELRRAGV